ncbi:MAG: hypothetical protein IKW03_06090 [Clostridia bacterium]|nr:hypothetical protein [Clostridia bacterium]
MSFYSLILSICIAVTTFLAPLATPVATPENNDDDFVPVLRFVATSDSHIITPGDIGSTRVAKMINTTYAYADADADYTALDAVLFSGDITDDGAIISYASFVAATDNVLREGTERLAVVAKSHDCSNYGKKALGIFTELTGQETDFHRIINGFHFIGISTSDSEEYQYTEEQVKWLDEQLAQAVADAPDQPVFVFNHEHVLNTVFGSRSNDGWGLDVFTEVFEKYPQVIDISGHSHYPANDPRAIWQDTFTALNDGGLSYYEFTVYNETSVHPSGSKTMTQALVIEVDAENRVLVKVLDVNKSKFVDEYLIDNVTDAQKTKYNHEYRASLSTAPVFSEDAQLKVSKIAGKYTVKIPQAETTGDNKVYLYRLTVTDENGNVVHTDWALSEYYFATVPDTVKFDSFKVSAGTYNVNVVAEDVWGNISTPLTTTINK